jgi:hypothetical protein
MAAGLQEPTWGAVTPVTIDGRFVIKGRTHGQKITDRGYKMSVATRSTSDLPLNEF